MRYLISTLALVAALLLSGCGQMGPLYQPGEDPRDPGTKPAEEPEAITF